MHFLYFIGAGASRAISEEIPLMDDFLNKAANLIEGPADAPIVLGFEAIYNAGKYWDRKSPFNMEDLQDPKKIEKLKQFYKGSFRPSSGELLPQSKNIEELFTALIENDDAVFRLTNMMSWLFCKLDKKISAASQDNPYDYLADTISSGNGPEHEHAFVSFNYDLWLEKSLFKFKLWRTSTGYVHPFTKYLDKDKRKESFDYGNQFRNNKVTSGGVVPIDLPAQDCDLQKKKIIVLKPHGSLNWVLSRYDKSEPPILLMEQDGTPSYPEEELEFHNIFATDRHLHRFMPYVIPPSPIKARSGTLFWSINKKMRNAIENADVVVIIGWSMPDTDLLYRQFFQNLVSTRTQQIKQVIVCDTNSNNSFYTRFEQIFQPSKQLHYKNGFSKTFCENVLVETFKHKER